MPVELTPSQLRRAGELSQEIGNLRSLIMYWQNVSLSTATINVGIEPLNKEASRNVTFDGKFENLSGIRDAVIEVHRVQVARLEKELERLGLAIKS